MVFHTTDRALLWHIVSQLNTLTDQGDKLMSKEQDVLDAVGAETDAGEAVVKLLDGIADDLATLKAGMDPAAAAKLDEAVAKLKANAAVYAAAVVRDTPAEAPADAHAAGM